MGGKHDWSSDSSEGNNSDTDYKIDSEELDWYSQEQRSKPRRKKNKLEWTNKDEISMLKQLREFLDGNDNASSYSPKTFYEFVKKRCQVSIAMKDLSDKIEELKKKYFESECRKTLGKDETTTQDERLVFVLCRRIWGPNKDSNSMRRAQKFMEFLKENEIHITCLTPSSLEYLKKEWQIHLLMQIHLLNAYANFEAKFAQCTLYPPSSLS